DKDETTTVARLKEGEFEINEDGCVDIFKEPEVTLKLGDPHFVTSIQSQLNSDRIDVRISHQDKF
ncbi:MAG: hypothetical protein Q7T54_00405, partial [Candidatus Levybacteria bacterium]|nr:hypothetical protein [Candidatus Levybacteria bacterium]